MVGALNTIGWFHGKDYLKAAVKPPKIPPSHLNTLLLPLLFWQVLTWVLAVAYPYLFAFEPSFVEIHSLETGALAQIIPGSNIRMLADGRGKLGEGGEILVACENSLPGAAGGMDGECQVGALIRSNLDSVGNSRLRDSESTLRIKDSEGGVLRIKDSESPKMRHSEDF
jgi:CNH domain